MKKILFAVISATVIVFIIFLILGSVFTDKFVEEEISKINRDPAGSKSISEIDSLDFLPLILKKYYRTVIIDSVAKPASVKLNITGKIKTSENSDWQELTAEQYLSSASPGYVWNAKLSMNSLVWARAIETYLNGRGNILIKLFSSVKISDAFGDPVNQSGLTRYLCESVFIPNALLPSRNLEWVFIEQGKLKAVIRDKLLKAEVYFYFNSKGEIIKIETTDRYRTLKTGYRKTLSSITFSDYKKYGDFFIPTAFETNWHTENGVFNFGQYSITGVQYN